MLGMEKPAKRTVTSLSSLFPAEEVQEASKRVQDTISGHQKELDQVQDFVADNASLISLVQKLPEELHHDIMVPFGKAAFFPGRLIHTNKFLVLLGESYYAERTSKQTIDFLKRRGKALESQVKSIKAVMQDLKAQASYFDATATEVAEGLVEITEEYTAETSAKELSKADNINALTEEEEFAKLMSKIDKVEKEELVEESDEDDDKDIINHTREPLESGSSSSAEGGNVRGTPTHGGRYVQYNVYGILFEVSRKYVPSIRPVGCGSYGIGCAAVNSETREEVAIKKIGNAFDNRIDPKRTLREIKLLRHMDHENVIALKDIIRPPQKKNFNDVYIVYELMDTDLHQIIRSNQPLNDDHCRYFLYQLLRGLKYVHSANVLHRDLKPSNLLLNLNCDLKIGDFGLARTTSETDFMTEYVVTWYRAPELLLNCSEYTAAIDIWSVGCILGEIMTRQPLFPGKGYVHQLRLITELIGSPDDASLGFLRSDNARRCVRQLPQYPQQQFSSRFPNMSPGALDLLEKMLVFDPNRRITVDEALCHPYLAPLHDINEEPVCPRHFSFDFEQPSFTEENIKELIWRELVKFNPDPPIQ